MANGAYLTTNNTRIRFELYGLQLYDIVWLVFVCLLIAASALDLRTCFRFCEKRQITALHLFWRLGDYLPQRGDYSQLSIENQGQN